MRNIVLAVSFATLPGCMIFDNPFVGVWLVEVGALSDAEVVTEIDENFTDGDPPDDVTVTGDWITTTDEDVSDAAAFVRIERGSSGELILIAGNDLYVGTVEEGKLTASWTIYSDGTDRTEHEPTGYFYEEAGRTETTVTYTLERDSENGGMTGKYKIDTSADVTYRETDEWTQEVGFQYGSIPSFLYLQGNGVLNVAQSAECQGNTCELTVVTESSREAKLHATATHFDEDESFQSIEDANQPGG